MGSLDGLVFTGGIGENSAIVRSRSVEGLKFLGLELDQEKNAAKLSTERFIDNNGAVRTMVIPTNEELVIARDTLKLVKR
jgi:acetate kinase